MALEDAFEELRRIKTYQLAKQRADYLASTITPEQAHNMQVAAKMWPDLAPGALLSLGRGNVPASSPLAGKAAELSAAQQMDDHPNGVQYGQPLITPGMRKFGNRSALAYQANQYLEFQRARGAEARALTAPLAPDFERAVAQAKASKVIRGGILREPSEKNEAQKRIFDNLLEQAIRNKEDLKFIDIEGRPILMHGGYGSSHSTPEEAEEAGEKFDMWTPGSRTIIDYDPEKDPKRIALREAREARMGPTGFTALGRAAFMTMDAPIQEVQGAVRNAYQLAHGDLPPLRTQSDIGVMLSTGISESGNGFFVDPESKVAQERRRREAESGQIGGHNVTLGRWTVDALTPFDPNTKPAMILSGIVDAGVAIAADPTAIALKNIGKARMASKLFANPDSKQASGVVRGLRWMVRPTDPEKFLDSDIGIGLRNAVAAEQSPYRIWALTGRKMPLRLARQLAREARTPDEVRSMLLPELGRSIRKPGTLEDLTGGKISQVDVMPIRGRIDAHDQDVVAFELEAFLRNVKAPDETIEDIVNLVADADGPIKLNAAIRESLRRTDGILDNLGIKNQELRDIATKLHENAHSTASNTFLQDITHQSPTTRDVLVGGQSYRDTTANLITELAPRWLTLPDARRLRRLTSKHKALLEHIPAVGILPDGKLKWGSSALEWMQNEAWKPLQLIRAAWMVRVIGEEQIRMAAAGYDSMFHHPASFISWRIGRKGSFNEATNLIAESNAHKATMSAAHGDWVDRSVVPTGVPTTYFKGEQHYRESAMSQIARLANDPVANRLARDDNIDDTLDWFTRGSGNLYRGDLASAYPNDFQTIPQARDYLERIQRRIDYHTSGDGELLETIKTGQFQGEDLIAGTRINRKALDKMVDKIDEFGPEEVSGHEMIAGRTGAREETLDRWDRFVDSMFGLLMTNRTNNLSRSVTFRQAYWKEGERLMSSMTPDAKARMIQSARETGLGSRTIRRMERVRGTGNLTLDDADVLAKSYGLEETKTLLYDLSRRGRFMDAARLIFPFGEAWNEVVTRWLGKPKFRHGRLVGVESGLLADHPQTLRRFQQTIQGSRGQDFGEVMGAPEGQGFFWKNEFGEEMFVYPATNLLTRALLGVEVPLAGRVQGLSMFGTVIPGIGPALQWPVGYILNEKPGPEWLKEFLGDIEGVKLPAPIGSVREALIPFGATGEVDPAELWDPLQYVSPWLKSAAAVMFNGAGSEESWADSIMKVMAYRKTNGGYGDSKEEQQRLVSDSTWRAKGIWFLKMIGQNVLPASPTTEWTVVTKNDKTVRIRALSEEFHDMQNDPDVGFDKATEEFIDKYGDDVYAAIQGTTTSNEYAVPVTRAGVQWVLEHPGIEDDLEHTYGFFAPNDDDEFDYSLYQQQEQRGERMRMSKEDFAKLMAATKGQLVWDEALKEIAGYENTDEGRAFKAETKAFIRENYPGWGDTQGLEKTELHNIIRELYEAVDHKAVKGTEAGRGLRVYLSKRDEVMAWAQEEGLVTSDGLLSSGKDAEEARVYLNDLGSWVVGEYPQFDRLWDMVLSREVEEENA